jgi:hypothetical protein
MADDIEPGYVYYLFCDNTKPPKNKYLVLLSLDPILWFFINSENCSLVQHDKSLLDRQIPLIRIPYHTFLDYDSYINCLDVQEYEDINLEDLKIWAKDPKILRGKIHQSVIEEIISKVSNPITIDDYRKNIIIKSLS